MTTAQARILQELMRSEEFEGILAVWKQDEMDALTRDIRNAVRSGNLHEAALCEGRAAAVEGMQGSLKRLAERYRAQAPDRR